MTPFLTSLQARVRWQGGVHVPRARPLRGQGDGPRGGGRTGPLAGGQLGPVHLSRGPRRPPRVSQTPPARRHDTAEVLRRTTGLVSADTRPVSSCDAGAYRLAERNMKCIILAFVA